MNNLILTEYMNNSVKHIIQDILKNTLNNPKETAFLLKYKQHSHQAMKRRIEYESKGQHIPPFLIASITQDCNLSCVGCYAQGNGICSDKPSPDLITVKEWTYIFDQASSAGIQFILLAGGEPLIRQEILEQATNFPNIVFPIFTNGTLIDDKFIQLLDRHRNLIPVLSMEGGEESTDQRRGLGTYHILSDKMHLLRNHRLLYGVSITVTRGNLDEVTNSAFIAGLQDNGCRIVFYIEYVPIDQSTKEMALSNHERNLLAMHLLKLKQEHSSIFFIAFPGDEQALGGCLAAGRGFFHISPTGNAEACPFAPYSDTNLHQHTLLEALQSEFFHKLQMEGLVGGEHIGGCTLFEKQSNVKKILHQVTMIPVVQPSTLTSKSPD